LNDFRAIMKVIVGKGGELDKGIVGKGRELDMPITAIVAIHHNLVTFGVQGTGTRPWLKPWVEPPGIGNKTYYSPLQACKGLLQAPVFGDSPDFGGKTPCASIKDDTRTYPGQDWVEASAYLI